jgi:UDP-N-acetylmuramoyl-L-alanyl-D-glutamate--2,6-diaminopimelate ligase
MNLEQLLIDVEGVNTISDPDLEITSLHYDSRQVVAGGLFFALPGEVVDGHDYVLAAIELGAVAVVAQRPLVETMDVPVVVVKDARQAMAKIAAAFYGYPARDLLTVGVTGTNGKTTMTYLVEALLSHAGYSTIVVGTVGNRLADLCLPAANTTPESLDLQRMLAQFRSRGGNALVIEVSSHALMQSRIVGIKFDVTVFTNLTPEHLDYHKNMESYFAAKAVLFTDLAIAGKSRAVINSDDPYGAKLLTMVDNAISVGSQACADVVLADFSQSLAGIVAKLRTPIGEVNIKSPLIGRFNMENLLCAVGVGVVLGLGVDAIEEGLSRADTVPGRLEKIDNELGAVIVVDYAHTGDALDKVLQAVAALQPARIITVFGCGGDRDCTKRAVMAANAAQGSQLVIVTSDNPRSENPQSILAEICQGLPGDCVPYDENRPLARGAKNYIVIEDRSAALQFAVDKLQAGDLLLVAGKGHEDYQIIGNTKIHFDDREQLRQAIAVRGKMNNKSEVE